MHQKGRLICIEIAAIIILSNSILGRIAEGDYR
jgi:hypothetical protein